MIKQSIAIALSLCFLPNAVAKSRIGLDGKSLETPESVCRLTLKDKEGNTAFCSGVMVASDRILTAGHCFDKELVRVECAYQSESNAFNFARPAEEFKQLKVLDEKEKSLKELTYFDYGVLKIKKPVEGFKFLGTMKRQKVLERFFTPASVEASFKVTRSRGLGKDVMKNYQYYVLKTGLDCRTSGFGNVFQNGKTLAKMIENHEQDFRKLHGAYKSDAQNLNLKHSYPVTASLGVTQTPADEFVMVVRENGEATSYHHTEFLGTGSKSKTTVEEGDSGGPLFCRANESEAFQLISINAALWNANGGTAGLNYGGNVFTIVPDEYL